MKELYTREGIEARKKRTVNVRRLAVAVGLLGLAGCILLCFGVRTANAQERQLLVIALAVLTGWAVILLTTCCILPNLREVQHEEGVLKEKPETCEGEIVSVGHPFQIPKSIAFCSVTLRGKTEDTADRKDARTEADNPFIRAEEQREKEGISELPLRINARYRRELPGKGTRIRVVTHRQYITAWQSASGAATERRRSASEEGRSRFRRGMRVFSHMLLWALAAAVFWSWIFTFLTDAPRVEKVTVYADMQTLEDRALAIRLEEHLPEGIRMIQVHAFRYAMLDASALETADLYIVTEAGAREHLSWLTDLPEGWSGKEENGAKLLCLEGRTVGIRIYDHADGRGAAASYLSYGERPGEDWYLCFGNGGYHLPALAHGVDCASEAVAEELLRLP